MLSQVFDNRYKADLVAITHPQVDELQRNLLRKAGYACARSLGCCHSVGPVTLAWLNGEAGHAHRLSLYMYILQGGPYTRPCFSGHATGQRMRMQVGGHKHSHIHTRTHAIEYTSMRAHVHARMRTHMQVHHCSAACAGRSRRDPRPGAALPWINKSCIHCLPQHGKMCTAACMHTRTHARTLARMHAWTHARMHARTHARSLAWTHARTAMAGPA